MTGLEDDAEQLTTFVQSLRQNVRMNSDKVFATWYNKKGFPCDKYTFSKIWKEAGAIAHKLRVDMKLSKGDRIVLCYSFGLQFFASFLGCLRAGVTAVLVYPPDPSSLPRSLPKMTIVANDCDAKLILVDAAIKHLRKLDQMNPTSKSRHLWPQNIDFVNVHAIIKKEKNAMDRAFDDESITTKDIAFFQYTSGSTGKPKGVMVSYGALEANVHMLMETSYREYDKMGIPRSDIVCFSWLPQYHDMGLIGATIAPFAAGYNCNFMSPVTFIQNPILWVKLMSKVQATWSVAPDFAYRLAARKYKEARSQGSTPVLNLDLSSIVRIYSGAEPIRLDTIQQFNDAFQQYGLLDDWFGAVYGLAENVLYVCSVDELKLSSAHLTADGNPFIAVGHQRNFAEFQESIKVVCPSTLQEKKDGQVGELWISCPSKASGYYRLSELSEEVFQAKISNYESNETFLQTGDLAFFEDGYLFICGRRKDLVIVNGVNYYPQDIEYAIQEAHNSVRPGCIASFSSNDAGGDGNLEVVFEVRKSSQHDANEIVNAVRKAIIQNVGLVPSRVVVIKEKSIPKTTSGKIQRRATRIALHNDNLQVVHEHTGPEAMMEKAHSHKMITTQADQQGHSDVEAPGSLDGIIASFFGPFDPNSSWEELGMSSMTSVQLRDAISGSLSVSLSPDCFVLYPTPSALKDHIAKSQGIPLQVSLPSLTDLDTTNLSPQTLGYMQFIGSIFLLLLLACSIVPSWHFGKVLANNASIAVQVLGIDSTAAWTYVPLAVPAWMFFFSMSIILLKWIMIWKYKEGVCSVSSMAHLRWWFVDRAVALWEFWVGRFIKDTPLINLVYSLMGANIHRSAKIDAFVREFDLVEVGPESSIEYPIVCRKFSHDMTNDDSASIPSIRFRSVSVGKQCTIKGMVSLGSSVCDGALIDKLSVMPEGAIAPSNTRVAGNPSFALKKELTPSNMHCWWMSGMLKIMWLAFELYLFFGIMLLAQYLWVFQLPSVSTLRYAPLLKWVLLILWFGVLSVGTSITIKWMLIGKRRSGPYHDTLLRSVSDWAADWHYRASTSILLSLTSNSRIWNVILMMHGMDVDFVSKIQGHSFLPSQMDLVRVRKSFISVISFCVKKDGMYCKIEIIESSVGFFAHVDGDTDVGDEADIDVVADTESATHSKLQIRRALIAPLTHVSKDIMNESPDKRFKDLHMYRVIFDEMLTALGYILSSGLFVMTMIPSYEVFVFIARDYQYIWMVVPALASALILQMISWTILLAIFQFIAQLGSKGSDSLSPWSDSMYAVFLTANFAHQNWSCIRVFHGSVVYNFLVATMGAKFEGKGMGRAILLPRNVYEYAFITFGEQTIVDNADLNGHFVVYSNITLGPSRVSGLIHQGSYIANAAVTADGSEPWRSHVGTYSSYKQS